MSKTLDHIYPKQQLIQYGLYILPLQVIKPEHFEPLNRILRATIPERKSQLKSIILFSVDYLREHYL